MRPSFAQFRSSLNVFVAIPVLLVAGCASLPPPTAELDAAVQAVGRAEAADADQHAPAALAEARAALQQAQAAMAKGREEEARNAALSASTSGDFARVQGAAARTRADYQQRLAEIEGLAIEDNVVEWALSSAKVLDKPLAFDELMAHAKP